MTTVTFKTYTDDQCTELATLNGDDEAGIVNLDLDISCNPTPDASLSELTCYTDGIMYINHPNTGDCTADPICNEIPIGVCQYFPGPVPSWK